VWLLFTLRSRTFGAYVAGKWAFLRQLPAALHHRRSVQAARRMSDRELLVGGPLTIAPHLKQDAAARWIFGALDGTLSAWWRAARWISG
jgi:hypothetical protein